MDVSAGASPRRLARMAGALYLVNIVLGVVGVNLGRWRQQAKAAVRRSATAMEALA